LLLFAGNTCGAKVGRFEHYLPKNDLTADLLSYHPVNQKNGMKMKNFVYFCAICLLDISLRANAQAFKPFPTANISAEQ
jgi:hypothetical protein